MIEMDNLKYFQLEKRFEEIAQLNNILSIINWDYCTYMPKGSVESRQQEITTLSTIVHNKIISDKTAKLIEEASLEISHLDSWQQANLREIKKNYTQSSCISEELQKKYTKAASNCEFIWRDARQNNDFNLLKPHLDELIKLVKEIAEVKAEHFKVSPYNALLDMYDPGSESKSIRKVFEGLKTQLPHLIQKITAKQAEEVILPLNEKVSIEQQKIIGKRIMEIMGFDFNKGRLDESVHPFCGGTANDLRLTTRYNESNFITGLMGIIHETGHALYELNLPSKYQFQPVGNALGMAFHESQSLIMEMQAGTSREFIEFLSKILHDEFGFKGKEYSSDNLFKIVTRVKPGFIRVDADEVTYPLHVIIRFEIEEALLNGQLKLEDLPEVWNAKMKEYLGIVPSTYSEGCLQDIHWPSGFFGYFPAYTKGAIIASMAMKKATNEYPNLKNNLREGSFEDLNNFLNKNLRNFGSLKTSEELLESATNYKEIKTDIFLDYLQHKYL